MSPPPQATTTVASPPAAPPAAPIVALPHNEAVMAAAREVFSKAGLPPGQKYSLVIDPLVDGTTHIQSLATAAMEQEVVNLVKTSFPQYEIKAFSAPNVATLPLIMVGTFTPINLQGKAEGERDAYRICFALADLRTGKIVSKGFARSQTSGVDATPMPFFRDSPLWVNDKIVEGYVRTCQGTKAGDPINPAYIDKVVAATTIDEAMRAYNARKYRDALALYNAVLRNPAGDQPRVHAGIYLTQLKLGNRAAAMQAFGKVVQYGLAGERLAVKFNFRPGGTAFAVDGSPYDMWVREIAQQAAKSNTSCIAVAGHASRGGAERMNETVSLQRAEYVRQRMVTLNKDLAKRVVSQGMGSKQVMVGTGRDDASDALDRRIEFKPAAACV
ncbi:MAG TPA: OmpA family protein [Burkholderiaceae bacterium]|nr:OmpA family protein [Burkholderiaceae bacterium]